VKPIRKAVFPVGGLGTRFLPATKALPKEMLPIVDKPLIEYAVEEAREAGIEEFVFVTGRGKTAIQNHFDSHLELEYALRDSGRDTELSAISPIGVPGQFAYVRQMQALGLGHAVWTARNFIGNEPFAVLLADDLMSGEPGALSEMTAVHEEHGGNVVALMEVDGKETARYGVIAPGEDDGKVVEVLGLVEKPDPTEAPSNLAIVGRYILQPEVLDFLALGERGAGGEIQLTDSMARLIGGAPFNGVRLSGRRYDCGTKVGFLEANVAFALERDDLGCNVAARIQQVLDDHR